MDELTELKLEIKNWEREFQRLHGSQPAKEDIKNSLEIAHKYKRYRQLKSSSSRQENALQKQNVNENENEETAEIPESPEITRIGPTPQLHGRVLGLFDVMPRTPEKSSPSKQFSTPTRSTMLNNGVSDVVQQALSPMVSSPAAQFDSTPSYLNRTIGQSLSPLAPRKVRRGLSCLIAELQQIKEEKNLTMEEEFVEIEKKLESEPALELDHLGEQEESEAEDNGPDQGNRKYKKKGQKRSTKKHVFKARPVDEAGNFDQSAVKVRKTSTENYRRLKINSGGHKGSRRFPFKRR